MRETDAAAEAYFKSLGFQIIIGDTDEMLDFLADLASGTKPEVIHDLSQRDFGTGKIPNLTEAPVRPISDYFRGHAPTWHDILSNRIPVTSKFSLVANQINTGRHVMLSGIPVSGKSTVLMQVAAYFDTKKVKLFEDVITVDKARSIVAKVSGKGQLLLFLDNVGDSVDALDILTACKDIQVVAADRSVNIGFGTHRFNMAKFVLVDCSDLESRLQTH